ncbi:MAG: HIT family protein [bacterium]
MDCLFCKISKKQIPAAIIYEDNRTQAFLDIEPRAPGHVLVIPKVHAETIGDLPDKEIGPLFTAVKNVVDLVVHGLGADGATIGANQGKASGQVVDHLHIHIIPRFFGDGGGAIQSVVSNKPKESVEEIRKKIVE